MRRTDDFAEKNRNLRFGRFLKAGILVLMLLLLFVPAEASAAARISKKNKTLLKGQSFTLKVKGTSQKVRWSSSKRSVATVNSSGLVKGKKAGRTVITATAGKNKFTCSVTVRQAVKSVTLNKTSISLAKGNSAKLTAKVKPDKAFNKALAWESSDSSVASVSDNGKVTANSSGIAVITARAKDGSGMYASCTVSVQESDVLLTLSETSITLNRGETTKLSASGARSQVSWGSSDTSVVTVSADGTVSAMGAGQAKIVAMTLDGQQYAYCDVTVIVSVPTPSIAAQQFMNILMGYSQEIMRQKAAGHFLGYSNSSSLVKSTWAQVLNDMTTRGIGYTNCAHMVCLALRNMGRLGANQSFWGDNGNIHFGAGVEETLRQSCEIIPVNKAPEQLFAENGLLPGDICIWSGIVHTNVYAGDQLWIDAGRGSSDGSYMSINDLKTAGVPEQTLTEDIRNDNNNPDLDRNIYIFNSMNPKGISLGTVRVTYIIRLVR